VSYLALFQTTLHRNCYPSFAAAWAANPVAVGVAVGDVGGVVVGVLDVGGVVTGDEGGAGLDTVTDGVALVGGASCVGLGDVRPGVGPAGWVANACDVVSSLVPGEVPPAAVACTEAVAGVATWLAD